jgi:predicted ATPase
MLKSWYIQNFKAILDSGKLKLAPVTVLAGRNSSGKSSLIQSILMIAQTLGNRLPDRALLPNGPIVQLGTFEDILSEQTNLRAITVGFTLEEEKEELTDEWEWGFERIYTDSVKITAQFRSSSSNGISTSAIEASKVNVESVSLDVRGTHLMPIPEDDNSFAQGTISFELNAAIRRLSSVELGELIKDVSPEYLRLVPYINKELNYQGNFTHQNIPDYIPETSLITLFHFLPMQVIEKSGTILKYTSIDYIREVEAKTVQFFTSKIRYLGPLRADPQASQKFAPSSEIDDVGAKGEYSAVVYHANQNAIIQWYNPSTEVTEESALNVALNTWVRYLGVAHEIKTQEIGPGWVSWQVIHMEGHKALPLSAVGAGISQILPILVTGLLAPNNTLLIVEEPELGLHSSAQARLGDFFVGLAKCSKQCLIETHSENLVSQLRLHIVKAGGQEDADCLIYFVDQDEQGAAQFNPIEISSNGNILNWPDGFFDETMLQEDNITAEFLKNE